MGSFHFAKIPIKNYKEEFETKEGVKKSVKSKEVTGNAEKAFNQ